MRWVEDEYGYRLEGLPLWNDYFGSMRVMVWLAPRPPYCDRGQWLAGTDAPLDGQEGWPRYYFDLDTAKREVIAWVEKRREFKNGG